MGLWTLSFGAAIAIGGMSAQAHHSISSVYDSSRQVTLEGTVAQFQLVNPHPYLLIDVNGGADRTERWQLEMDNRSELAAIGVTPKTFKPGDRVVVTGSLARGHGERMYLLRLDRAADGFWYEQIGQSPRIGTQGPAVVRQFSANASRDIYQLDANTPSGSKVPFNTVAVSS